MTELQPQETKDSLIKRARNALVAGIHSELNEPRLATDDNPGMSAIEASTIFKDLFKRMTTGGETLSSDEYIKVLTATLVSASLALDIVLFLGFTSPVSGAITLFEIARKLKKSSTTTGTRE